MQLTSMTLKDGRMELNGYPEGATVRGLALPQAAELCRLMLFRGDLTYVVDCIEAANKMEVGSEKRQEHLQREALCSSALIRFFCCFEGTSGLRSKPLRRKSIFSGDDRKAFERLRQIRNQAVAHNEHLYPGEFPLIVQDADGAAIEAVVLSLQSPFSAMHDVGKLQRLATAALQWVGAEFEAIAKEVVDTVNAIPADERRVLRDMTPEFTIEFSAPEDRFARR